LVNNIYYIHILFFSFLFFVFINYLQPSEENSTEGFNVVFNFEPNVSVTIPMGKCIVALKKTLMQSTDVVQQVREREREGGGREGGRERKEEMKGEERIGKGEGEK
jgi:hypothetical protein